MIFRPVFGCGIGSAFKIALILLIFAGARPCRGADSNGVLREVYQNIPGLAVTDLTTHPSFPESPTFVEVLTGGFEAPVDVLETYGQRLSALVVAPTTGDYTFWIASDDGGALYLSSNESPAQKQLIASVPGWTGSREWGKYAEQQSTPIRLEAGQRYYLEALMKEQGGGDNLAVQWELPNGTIESPIPNSRLIVFGLDAPIITSEPADATVAENGEAVFEVELQRTFGVSYQWQRNGVDIPGATDFFLVISPVSLDQDGDLYRCLLENAQGTAVTREARLTVEPDSTRPALVSALNLGDPGVLTVTFSEAVEEASAIDETNYSIDQGVLVEGARLMSDLRTVVLETSGLTGGTTYTLTVNDVRDRAQSPNTIVADSSIEFSLTFSPLDANVVRGISEPAGPSSRGTPLTITEIMYHPPEASGRNLEYIEIFNSDAVPLDVSGFRLAGDVAYTFPDGTVLAPNAYLVIAAVPGDVTTHFSISNVQGPYTGELPNSSGLIEVRNRFGAALLEVEYEDTYPWPVSADGAGHSLVLARASYGEGDVRAWGPSDVVGGSPGRPELSTANPLRGIFINEFLAHTDDPQLDYIELYNYTTGSLDISGCYLSDERNVNKFQLPPGSIIPARGFLVFDQSELGFALSTEGEEIYLRSADQTRIIDAVRFPAQSNGVSMGRFPDGADGWHVLAELTPGSNNSAPRPPPVVINELMYNSIGRVDEHEFVELHNITAEEIDLSGWAFTDGIDFIFPEGASIAGNGFVVVTKSVAAFRENYPEVATDIVYGDYGGSLADSGERVALSRREQTIVTSTGGQAQTVFIYTPMDEVTYRDGGRWPGYADAGGSSLELIDPRSDNNQASNWADSDESGKSTWTEIEHTGVMDLGQGAIDELHVLLLGDGECLVDDLEVIPQGGVNQVPNGTLEGGLQGWVIQGTHSKSGLSDSGQGYESSRALHLRSSSGGDNGVNRVEIDLNSTLNAGGVATIRGKARWLRGHRDLLLRLHGNHLEAVGTLDVPTNLGTPGEVNSQAVSNAGPAIFDVTHSPVMPNGGQNVTVRVRAHDSDGLSSLVLRYRVDPNTNYTRVNMEYRGAGLYTGTIPSQANGALVAFSVEAADAGNLTASTIFPNDAPARECLVRFGDPRPNSSFGTYRLWLTAATVQEWSTRQRLSNETLDGTFVYGDFRAIYNAGGRYRGSPFIRPGYNSPVGNICAYVIDLPKDDQFLGEDKLNLDSLEPGRDDTSQREKMSFWIADQLNVPFSHLRYIQLYVNGVRRSDIYTDSQRPDAGLIQRWYADDDRGEVFKIDDWFEFNDGVGREFNVDARLENYTTTGGVKKKARYRWAWEKKPNRGVNENYQSLFDLVDALNTPGSDAYTAAVEAVVDVEEWVRIFAVRHIVGDWDGYGYNRGKNMFTYKPVEGGWQMLLWDLDFSLGGGSDGPTADLFAANDPVIRRFYDHPPFRRAYLRALHDAANGPLLATRMTPAMNANHSALIANGISAASPNVIQSWVDERRNYILQVLAGESATFAITSNDGNDFSTGANNLLMLAGTAPVEVRTILVNGAAYPVTWPTVTAWQMRVPLEPGGNPLVLTALDSQGEVIQGFTDSINVTYTGTGANPADHLVINEIMYHPAVPESEFVEIHNTSSSFSFDLSGYRLDGIDFDFPAGTIISPGGFIVVARDRGAFISTYGAAIPVVGEYPGTLQQNGERLRLVKKGSNGAPDELITEVRYSNDPPWPSEAAGEGPSLQLIDPARDNGRAGNWGVLVETPNTQPQTVVTMTSSWRYNDSGLDLGTSWRTTSFNDSSWPSGAGLLYVEGAVLPAPKNTMLQLGASAFYFRTKFTNNMPAGTPVTLALSTIVDDGVVIYLNGQEILRHGMAAGPVDFSTFANRTVGEAVQENFELQTDALGPGVNVIAAEVHQVNGTSSDIVFGLSLVLEASGGGPYTPGAANSVRTAMPEFPDLALNELQTRNANGPLDNAGEREPWAELYNGGTSTLDLEGFYLSDNYETLRKWAFPAGTQIAPGEFKLVWLDSHSGQGTATDWHTSFRIGSETGGSLALSREEGTRTILIDYLNFDPIPEDRAHGIFPDGAYGETHTFAQPTPGEPNTLETGTVTVFINEWMAANSSIQDPADGAFDDWFELYNSSNLAADISGFVLTDDPTDLNKYVIPQGTVVPARGFLLVWADEQSTTQNGLNGDLHVNFRLGRSGEYIGLYAPDGTLIDEVTFGEQADDVSEGRLPDGGPGPFENFATPTPGTSNAGLPSSVEFGGITHGSNGEISFSWQSENGVTYAVEYKDNLEEPAWTELDQAVGDGSVLSIIDTTNEGVPHRFYRLVIVP